eukprot:7137912-Prymnesium_polylepis.1
MSRAMKASMSTSDDVAMKSISCSYLQLARGATHTGRHRSAERGAAAQHARAQADRGGRRAPNQTG